MMGWWIWPEIRGAGGLGHRAGPGRRARRQEASGAAEAFALPSWNRQVGSPWRQNSPIWFRSRCERGHEAGRPRLPTTFLPFLESLRRVRWHGRGREAASVCGLIFSSHGQKYNCQHDDPSHDNQRGHCPGSYLKFLFCRVSAHSTPWFAASFACNHITGHDAKCAVDPKRT
jgi:hypothetical protein